MTPCGGGFDANVGSPRTVHIDDQTLIVTTEHETARDGRSAKLWILPVGLQNFDVFPHLAQDRTPHERILLIPELAWLLNCPLVDNDVLRGIPKNADPSDSFDTDVMR